ncbi:hypothetical protein AMJ39_01095 [candidate division TA06 bacterium DG_24]|uniref:histidine kinase n=2 Tax=Bacteria division TA06 TaxID=1156500 RepID=A0A0S8GF55_UNCT6|nr:MAG: hypothetical protein AMJ39_01095 [candidate division TA06 bacterium DG_24]KPK71655.1 MAG: hypothetical protein AMJ82_00070 [candidate division TA06 bacterium SM23_40]
MTVENQTKESSRVSTLDRADDESARLLVVDDDKGMRETLADILEMEGYEVDAVGEASAARELVARQFYHLALIDLRLPGVDGLDLLTQIKGTSPDTIVMVVTGHASLESSVDAINLGAEGYILKPIDIPGARSSIGRALEKQRLVFENRRLLEELRGMNVRLEQNNMELQQEIAGRKSLQAQLVESEKMLGIYQLAAGVTHEIANPLTTVMGRTQLLLRKAKELDLPREVVDSLEIIQYEAARTVDTLDNLSLYSRSRVDKYGPCNVNVAIERTLSLFGHELDDNDILLTLDLSPELPEMAANESQLMRAFAAIIRNASQAMPGGGELTIETRSKKGEVHIAFRDTGVGIPEDIRSRVFEPFFTTRDPGRGTGVGLSEAYKIVKDHGGSIGVESSEGKGTTIRISLSLEASDSTLS